jgi:hypothetical protein
MYETDTYTNKLIEFTHLADTLITTPYTDKDMLIFDGVTENKFVNRRVYLSDLFDIDVSTAVEGNNLVYTDIGGGVF